MDPSWWLLFAYVLMLTCSAFFSASENAMAASNKIRLRAFAEEGKRGAKTALRLTEKFDETLTTILVGNNIVNVAGASIATVFSFRMFSRALSEGRVAEGTVTIIVTIVTTVIVFLFGEMTPKSFALAYADRFACFSAPILRVLQWILRPLVWIFGGVGELTRRLTGVKPEPTVTEEELSAMFEDAEEAGTLDEDQEDLLQSALEFSETTVADVITLRDDIVGIKLGATYDTIMELAGENKHSRFPVYENDLDHIIGVLQIKNYLKAHLRGERLTLKQLCSAPFYTTLDASIHELLEEMSREKVTMAIVRDPETGRTLGLVTIEDFLEELVGEIYDEDDVVNDRFMKLGGNYFRVSADCTMGEMFRDMSYSGKVNMSRVKTVNTWVMENLGHTPEVDDTFVWRDLTVTVTDVTEDGKLAYVEVKLANELLDSVTAPNPVPDEAKEGGDAE